MKKLRTAIVGCGKVGHFHARALTNLANSEFVAVCSTSIASAKAFGQQYGVSAFDSVDTMVDGAQVDVVCICTPHPLDRLTRSRTSGRLCSEGGCECN
ncbi:hypothetical protein LMG28614_06345 [Paraburkholderia ultramafica]|uniref:Gfo/Idh/MocA-like oxidoreductase N-terminal domain-containing protein n=1 Tax=Paraburkholderia ultramafica TaxID=1544867 RepID=A0A6S7BMN1_9BURK|nr:Gfo/Idh/MocA family oxidoreductase [Paraburkholderia ultramafica]CAB3806236.1 hypothetical protein LMG28614_06345 [Paraburkholderia ultramafica]